MVKGLALGLLMQCMSAVGYLVMVNVTSIKSEWFRTGIMICFAGVVALAVTAYTVFSGQQSLTVIQPKEYALIAAGSIMVMFVAQTLFFFGVRASNMTTMGLTLLAFPFISLILEVVTGRIALSSLGLRDLIAFALIAAGYVIFVFKPQSP
jgi:drug/metabolite transporter (DMT)-like permease